MKDIICAIVGVAIGLIVFFGTGLDRVAYDLGASRAKYEAIR